MAQFTPTDDDSELASIGIVFILISGVAALLIAFIVWTRWDQPKKSKSSKDSSEDSAEHSEEEVEKEPKKPNPFRKTSVKQNKWKNEKVREVAYEHPWLVTTLKGHVGRVLDVDFSPNGKFLVSACQDRTLFLWYVKDFGEREHKFSRGLVELDNAKLITFAPDSKSVVVSLNHANKLDVYKVVRKEEGSGYRFVQVETVDFPVSHTKDINSVGIACHGKFVMSSCEDNRVVLYTLHGEVLKVMEPKLNMLFSSIVSPCGRFVAACGFTPDVFVFEVLFDRQGNFQDAKRVYDLTGHMSGVMSCAFNQNSTLCVTASKDGRWLVFDTDIRYAQGETAKIIASGEFDLLKTAAPESISVAMSPSGNSFAIGASRHLRLFSTLEPEKQFDLILDVHQEPIRRVRVSPCGKMIATCGDRHIRIFHNVAEYFGTVVSLERALRNAREDAQKRRLQEQIEEAKEALKGVLRK